MPNINNVLGYAEYCGVLAPLCIIYTIVNFLTRGFGKNSNANNILWMEIPVFCATLGYIFITSFATIPIIFQLLNSFFIWSIVILVMSIPIGFLIGFIIYRIWLKKNEQFISSNSFEPYFVNEKTKKAINTYSFLIIGTSLSLFIVNICLLLSIVATIQAYSVK